VAIRVKYNLEVGGAIMGTIKTQQDTSTLLIF